MFKPQITILLITFLFSLTGCKEEVDTGPNIKSLKLNLSKNRIVGDGVDYTTVSVLNQDGIGMMEQVTVLLNGETITSNKIVSSRPGIFTIYAQYNNIKSNEAQLEVVEDKNLKFEKNVLIEQYTGTWCGWCPRAINQINTLQKTDKKVVHVAYHLSDEMTYNLSMSLFQSFGFTGIPTVHADRNIVWNGEVSAITPLHSPSRVGISLEVTGDAASISANVNVKFGYDFSDDIKLSVYLVHDSLIANQANYYNTDPNSPYYLAGSPMVSFVHRNVMMKSGTDMFGDIIPPASVDIGSLYSKKIDFTSFNCNDIKKMVIIVFITSSSGSKTDKVLNCIKAKVGEKLEFVYKDS